VQCKKCGNNVNIGLRSWLDLSTGSKVWEVVSEMLAPSFLADESGVGRFLLNLLVFCFVSAPAIIGLGSSTQDFAAHKTAQAVEDLAVTPFGLWYPVLLVWRVLRLRAQSIRYKRDGQIFKW
jgi:hypothetical protein